MNKAIRIYGVYNVLNKLKTNGIQAFRPISASSVNKNKQVKFSIEFNGKRIPISCPEGSVLRDVIASHSQVGQDYGICDGTLSCSTCHIIFNQKDFDRLPIAATQEEEDVLDITPNYTDTSRLACGVYVTPEMNGMVIKIPENRVDRRIIPIVQEN